MAAGRALAAALISHPRWHTCRCMLGFAATSREPATAPALAAAYANGLVVGLPRVAVKLLHYHAVAPGGASAERMPAGLQRGYRGVAEPAPDAPRLDFDRLPPEVVVLVPGAAFDRAGGRLGWGRRPLRPYLGGAGALVRQRTADRGLFLRPTDRFRAARRT